MLQIRSVLAVASMIALMAPARAETPPTDLAAAFAEREYIQQISLSPDGEKIAIVAATGRPQATVLLIADVKAGGEPKQILNSSGDPDRLRRCDWSTPTRLLCRIQVVANGPDAMRLDFMRLVAINSDGSNLKLLTAEQGRNAMGLDQDGGTLIDWGSDDASGSALVTRRFVPENSTGTHIASSRNGTGVELVNTQTLDRKLVEAPRADAVEYISDGHGTVRIMGMLPKLSSGYDSSTVKYLYRKPGERQWLALSEVNLGSRTGFNPYAVDRDRNVVYGFEWLDGRRALYSIALDGSMKRELVLARPDVDVAGLVSVGRHARTVGASFVTDKRQVSFFDPALVKLQASLAKAVPNSPLVSFVDASSDESKLLLFMGGDVNPGRYYLFDKTARKLEEVMAVRPGLQGVALSPVKAVSFPAADGTQIPGYLTLPAGGGKNLPAIVMPHGGPGARDEWGFDWLAQYYAARGYAVLQPNFRGSTGYGDAWFQKNGFQSWRTAVGDVNDGGRWLVKQGIADAGKLAIVGWSYGGYAALQSAMLDPALFKAIVAIAPVTDLDMLREESRYFTNFANTDRFIGSGPHVREGSPARNADKIKAPVLLFHGTYDRNVGVAESRLMADRIKDAGGKVDYVEFKGLDHYLDDKTARTRLLKESDEFLRASMNMPAQ